MLESPALLVTISHTLTALLVMLVLTSWLRWRGLAVAIPGGNWQDVAALVALFVLSALLRLLLARHTIIHTNFHGLYFLEIAAGPPVPAEGLSQRAPYGLGNYAFFNFVWLYLPRSIDRYFTVNALLAAAVPAQLYLLVRLLGGEWKWGLASALTLAVLPAHIIVSPTENDIVLCSFFALASLICWLGWLRTGRWALLAGALAWLVLLVHTRILVLVFPAAFVAASILLEGRREARFKSPLFVLSALAAAILILPQYLLVYEVLTAAPAASAATLWRLPAHMALPETNLLLAPGLTLPLLPLLALAGVILLMRKERRTGLLVALPLVTIAPLYLYFSGHTLDCLRYQFFVWPFYLLPAGYSLATVKRLSDWRLYGLALAALVVAILLPYLHAVRHEHAITQEFEFVRSALPRLPRGEVVLENRPLEVEGHPPIAPLTIPAFMVHEAGLGVSAHGPAEPEACGHIAYVGLQAHAYYLDEKPTATARLHLHGRARLAPLATMQLNPRGGTPGPDLVLPDSPIEIGFYRVECF